MHKRVALRPRRVHRHCPMGWDIRREAKAKFVLASGGDPARTFESVSGSGACYIHLTTSCCYIGQSQRMYYAWWPQTRRHKRRTISPLAGTRVRSEPPFSASAALTAPRSSLPELREAGRCDGQESPAAWYAAGACMAL